MDEVYKSLASKAISILKDKNSRVEEQSKQVFVGIAGGPGSGKTTTAAKVCDLINAQNVKALVLPMDGYHYYRKQLDEMENPKEAHRFRGAPFTFDAKRFVSDIQSAKKLRSGSFPDFDHKVGDPCENQIILDASVQILLIEGNYVLLNEEPWCELPKSVFDTSWFISCPEEEAQKRVVLRHMKAWDFTEEQALNRWLDNDLKNYRFINENSAGFNLAVESLSDTKMK